MVLRLSSNICVPQKSVINMNRPLMESPPPDSSNFQMSFLELEAKRELLAINEISIFSIGRILCSSNLQI
jgi:hypothetical protein